MIRFTVVTITYNAEAVLQRTLESVFAQTYKGVEHLIIDGASKDRTLALVEAYKQKSDESETEHKVIIQSEPDHGIYHAMNKGLTQSSGDYIVFMNAGDCFPQADTLEQVVHRCKLTELPTAELPGVLYGNTDVVDGDGHYLHPRRLQPPAFSADVDWCIRVMRETERLGLPLYNIGIVVANYLDEGATTKNHKASLRERYLVMQRHYGVVQTFLLHCWFVVRAIVRR